MAKFRNILETVGNTPVVRINRLAPPGVTVHFDRMVAHGNTGSHEGQDARNAEMLANLDENVALMSLVKPSVIVLAHTASSYALGNAAEAALVARLSQGGIPFITAFGAVIRALRHLGARRVALATPYSEDATLKSKAHLEANGFEVPAWKTLENVTNIYDETPERAAGLARGVDVPAAQAVFMSGTGMPTIEVLGRLEKELGKPVLSSATAMMWDALRTAGYKGAVEGYGSLLSNT